MTKKLDELFNLPDLLGEEEILQEIAEMTSEQAAEQSAVILDSISNSEKIDTALCAVSGISNHDSEMNDIATKALKSYQDLMTLGMNVSDAHAGRIFEVSNMMLETALKAKDAKVNRKLKTVELQLKKARLDLDTKIASGKGGDDDDSGAKLDRNEILKIISQKNNT